MDPILDPLNDGQRQAVLHVQGPLLVLAGAGSGKTRVIVHRIAHLVRDLSVPPWQILAVTFTNKAAGEMRQRLEGLLGAQARESWVQTFHAFGARFLRREAARAGLAPSFAIYDDADQMALMKRLFAEAGFIEEDRLGPRQALARLDRWKNLGLWPGEVRLPDHDVEGMAALELYRRYQRALARAGAADFGDLLVLPLRLLEGDPDLCRRWSGRFRHILVDEFQDTSPAQYRLVRLLAGAERNVCAVGDDDQAIYRWRGADVANILGFDEDFPGTRVIKLEQNYRSTQNVLDAAHAVISRALRRREKRLWTERERGAPLGLVVGQDEHDEAERIGRAVQEERLRGTRGDEVAVLYRVNAQSRPIEAALRALRIPYVIVRGTSFYERAEVKDAAAYLRLALEPRSDLDLARVINRPPRGLGEKAVERLRSFAEAEGLSLYEALARRDEVEDLKPQARKALGAFRGLVADLHGRVAHVDAGLAVQEAITRSGLLERLEAEESDEAVEKVENLLELVAAAREFDEARAGEPPPRDPEEPSAPPLARFLEQIALLGEADAPTPEGRVALMTLHAAKGLEFQSVFIAGLEEGMLPYQRPWRRGAAPEERDADLDEERRLCYVGMSRAKSRLTLSLARRRMGYGEGGPSWRDTGPSRFLGDLPPDLFGLPTLAAEAAPASRRPRRRPGSVPGELVVELDEAAALRTDDGYDQRPEQARPPFAPGSRVLHATLGEGVVRRCDGAGATAKVTVAFFSVGEKRVVARFLRRA